MKWIVPRTDILPKAQSAIWPLLSQIEPGFVLYGGTAVALHYGHRQSVDFDFFGVPSFDPDAFKASYDFLKKSDTIQMAENTLSVIVKTRQGPVKLSFFGGLQFGRVGTPVACEDNLVRLASPLDLAVQKLKVIRVRSEAKDYLDLDCLLRHGVGLAEAMGAAEAIYPGFPIAVALRAMCYFDEGDVSSIPSRIKKRLIEAARAFRSPTTCKKTSPHLDFPSDVLASLKKARRERG